MTGIDWKGRDDGSILDVSEQDPATDYDKDRNRGREGGGAGSGTDRDRREQQGRGIGMVPEGMVF